MQSSLRLFTTFLFLLFCTSSFAADFNFLSFTVIKEGAQQKLVWKAENESAIVRYEIIRADNVFVTGEKIAEIPATGLGEYSFFDSKVMNKAYYQIKSIDANNISKYVQFTFFAPNVFTGTGNWNDNTKWSWGQPPMEGVMLVEGASSPLIAQINGHCTLTISGRTEYNVSIEIAPNAILTTRASFPINQYNNGLWVEKVIVMGQLINETYLFSTSPTGITIEENGLIRNNGVLQLGSTGQFTLTNKGTFENNGTFTGKIVTATSGTNVNKGNIVGNTIIEGNLTNEGTVAPGNSPGTLTINGNYNATATAKHNFEVGGSTTGNYDQLASTGAVNLNGTLTVTVLNGFVPTADAEIPIITGSINGTFTTVVIPSQFILVYNQYNVVLKSAQSLPVTFTKVSIKKEGSTAFLLWNVAEERNVEEYIVERSGPNQAFTAIGTVKASGLPQYQFTDMAPLSTSLYRIKSVDKDRSHKYSVYVRYDKGNSSINLQALPNVVRINMSVQHETASSTSTLIITALNGQILRVVRPKIGAQQTIFDLSSLSAGNYVLHYLDEKAERGSIKFIKQ